MYDELVKRLRDSEHEIDCSLCDRDCCYPDGKVHGKCIIIEAADAIEAQDRHILTLQHEMMAEAESHIAETNRLNKQIEVLSKMEKTTQWIPVTERLPECDLGAEVGNIEWISCGMVHAGCFGRGGKYRDAYFRTWTDAGEGMDAKDADYWRAVTLPEPPKEES